MTKDVIIINNNQVPIFVNKKAPKPPTMNWFFVKDEDEDS